MLCRFAKKNKSDKVYTEGLQMINMGTEDVRTNAFWGPGVRNVYIIHYVLTGRGYFNGTRVEKNQGFYIRADDIVHYRFDEKEPWQYFWLMFKGDKAEEISKRFIKTDENGIFSYGFSEEIYNIMTKLFSTKSFMTQSEALATFYYVMSLHEQNDTDIKSTENNYVASAKNIMHFSIHQPTTISKIASQIGISDRYLYNLFIKHEGIAPKKYMNALRINNAKALLESKDYTITEIASAVGFSDVMAFSSFFSKHEGISPSEYRKNE